MDSACRLCSSKNIHRNISKISGIWENDYPVSFCQECQAYFLETPPSEVEIESYYKKFYYDNVKSAAKDVLKRLFRELRSRSQARYVTKVLGKKTGLRILEIGAGDGCLLSKFKGSGQVLRGIEFSSVYQERARKTYKISLMSCNFYELNEKFDLIILSHVYEHFADLSLATRQLKSLLAKNGHMFIEVPHSPLPSEVPMEVLKDFLNTTHVHNFTPLSLSNYLRKNGFGIAAMDRFFYSLPRFIGHKRIAEVGRLFVEGTGLTFSSGLIALAYSLFHFIFRETAFSKVENHRRFMGFGDNIRIIVTLS